MTAITVEHLVKRFGGLTAVRDVSFDVHGGQVTALLGPNGAGKTTTIEILEGFQAPSGGTVRVLGVDPRRGGRAWRARIGLVLQSNSLDLQLTVAEALRRTPGSIRGRTRWPTCLRSSSWPMTRGPAIWAPSGGQRRRVDLGLGVIGLPYVLFPTNRPRASIPR